LFSGSYQVSATLNNHKKVKAMTKDKLITAAVTLAVVIIGTILANIIQNKVEPIKKLVG
jgi:ABC-type sulfate transport system permease component